MTVLAAEQQLNVRTAASRAVVARLAYRGGKGETTAGVAPGFVQGNLAILPEK